MAKMENTNKLEELKLITVENDHMTREATYRCLCIYVGAADNFCSFQGLLPASSLPQRNNAWHL